MTTHDMTTHGMTTHVIFDLLAHYVRPADALSLGQTCTSWRQRMTAITELQRTIYVNFTISRVVSGPFAGLHHGISTSSKGISSYTYKYRLGSLREVVAVDTRRNCLVAHMTVSPGGRPALFTNQPFGSTISIDG